MKEATWGEGARTPSVDWRMSAALENVRRGDLDLAEVTSLEAAVREWLALDADGRSHATLRPERAVQIDGVSHEVFHGDGIAALADLLSGASDKPPRG